MLYEVFIYTIVVERVRVGYVANICVIRLGTRHLIWTCEMHGSWIVQRILDILRMTTVVCYLMFVCVCVSFVRDFGSVTLLLSVTSILGVWSKNNRVMLPKSRTKDTQGRHQITCDHRYSYVGLRHILPNRVLTSHLSSLTSYIAFHSIENVRVSLWREPFHLLIIIGVMCVYVT
jgi:hypothetical protein